MKCALLVAWREYAENAKTRGFWLGLLLFPLILFLSIQVPVLLEQRATPVRYFILVDPSRGLAPAIEAALEKSFQRQMLAALKEYARKNEVPMTTAPSEGAGPAGRRPAPSLADLNEGDALSLETFVAKGGKGFFLAQIGFQLLRNRGEVRVRVDGRGQFDLLKEPARFFEGRRPGAQPGRNLRKEEALAAL